MTDGLPAPLLSQISELVADQMALHFPRERWVDLERGLSSAARHLGHTDVLTYARSLVAVPLTRKEIEHLALELTIGETYFLRERRTLEILTEHILPEIIRAKEGHSRLLRIWSAGCCTGEEAYTLAILLDRTFPELRHWQVSILATDINHRFLQKAATGIYGDWSFRDVPPWLKQDYFTPAGVNRFEVIPRIRERVKFAYLNLADDHYPSPLNHTAGLDLIFCRNVLMYFDADRIRRVAGQFHQALIEKGWFVVSATETSAELFPMFRPVNFEGGVVYQKGGETEQMAINSFQDELPPEDELIVSPLDLHFPSFQMESAAVTESEIASSEDPVLPETSLSAEERARLHADLGELSLAREWADKALMENKLDPGLHYLRAVILHELGATGEESASLKRALFLDSGFVMAYYALGNLAKRLGNLLEADKYFANVLGLLASYPSNDILPHSDGLAAGRLKAMVESARIMNRAA